MVKLGRIISDRKIKGIISCVHIINTDDFILGNDNNLPTLIIGIDNAKKILGEKFNILDTNVTNNLFWSFGKTEKRNYYEKTLNKFYSQIIENLKENIKYESLNIFEMSFGEIKKLIYSLVSQNNYIYISYHTIYIYNRDKVYGISFDELEYIGISRRKIIEKLNKTNGINNNVALNDSFLPIDVKTMFRNYKYLYPYFKYLDSL